MAITSTIGTIYTGEDVLLRFTMTPVIDITGWTLHFSVKVDETDPVPIISVAGDIVDGPTGLFSVSLSTSLTSLLSPNHYVWDVWRIDSGSKIVLALGKLNVKDTARVP